MSLTMPSTTPRVNILCSVITSVLTLSGVRLVSVAPGIIRRPQTGLYRTVRPANPTGTSFRVPRGSIQSPEFVQIGDAPVAKERHH